MRDRPGWSGPASMNDTARNYGLYTVKGNDAWFAPLL